MPPRTDGFDPQKLEVPLGTNRKQLNVGDDRALFLLSRGRCYAPGCAVPAFQKVDGHYKALLRRAHICAHDPGGPRYDPSMSQEERDSWTNMLLLCDPHHGKVDSVKHLADYPVALLRQWKSNREEGLVGDLPQLHGISDLDLQQILLHHVEGILDSIDTLQGVSRGVIDEVKSMVEHQFTGPAIDADSIAMFSDTVMMLRHLELDYAVSSLRDATAGLQPLRDLDFFALRQLGQDLDRAAIQFSGGVERLSEHTSVLSSAHLVRPRPAMEVDQDDWIDGIRQFWPYISKSFVAGLLFGAAAIGALWAWSAAVI
jgi:hypothetical protein